MDHVILEYSVLSTNRAKNTPTPIAYTVSPNHHTLTLTLHYSEHRWSLLYCARRVWLRERIPWQVYWYSSPQDLTLRELYTTWWCHQSIKEKHFPRYWPFVRGIHQSPFNSPHKGQWRGALMFSLICALNERLSKQSWSWWFETPSRLLWRHCN